MSKHRIDHAAIREKIMGNLQPGQLTCHGKAWELCKGMAGYASIGVIFRGVMKELIAQGKAVPSYYGKYRILDPNIDPTQSLEGKGNIEKNCLTLHKLNTKMDEKLLTPGTRMLVVSNNRTAGEDLIELTIEEATAKACLIKVGKVSTYWKRKAEIVRDFTLFEIIHRPSQY